MSTIDDNQSGPRHLLRRLHHVMAGTEKAQDRLDRVVGEIAKNMHAEVCSVYLLRRDGALELFATEGLKKEAIHQTRLRVGEGLVGFVAEEGVPISSAEASSHTRFVYRPETGEELYHSFLGVPIVRAGLVTGVLVVQNIQSRAYTDEEEEVLQTVAMVLAELVGSGELVSPDEAVGAGLDLTQPQTVDAQVLADGVAVGAAVFHERRVEITHLVAEDVDVEKGRLMGGLSLLRSQLENLMDAKDLAGKGDHREVLDAYRMFAYDKGWQRRMLEAIESGLTAEAAVERILQDIRSRMQAATDPYLRERMSDMEDLSNRLLRTLLGKTEEEAHLKLTEDSVVVARTMGPAELLDYDRQFLKAIVLEEGSANAHVTIVARALGIPMLGRVAAARRKIFEGDTLIADGDSGRLCIRADDALVDAYRVNVEARQSLRALYSAQRDLPATTKDGVEVKLMMNAGLMIDMAALQSTGASGIGLFRTEFQFMVSSTLPKLEAQRALYRQVLEESNGQPVVFRTLDIGGDKPVPFLRHDVEENPALGWRAIRLLLGRPVLLRYQIRALLEAAEGHELRVMFPMISEVSEFETARAIVDGEIQRMERMQKPLPEKVLVGCMLEVPALAWQLDHLMKKADFLSIGTNDLMQFFFASDRSNPKLSDRYDLLSPAVLSFIRSVVVACERAGKPVSLCGEMGAKPLEAMALVGLGLRSLSLSPSAIGSVKALVREMDMAEFEKWLMPKLETSVHSLRDDLFTYAQNNHIPL